MKKAPVYVDYEGWQEIILLIELNILDKKTDQVFSKLLYSD